MIICIEINGSVSFFLSFFFLTYCTLHLPLLTLCVCGGLKNSHTCIQMCLSFLLPFHVCLWKQKLLLYVEIILKLAKFTCFKIIYACNSSMFYFCLIIYIQLIDYYLKFLCYGCLYVCNFFLYNKFRISFKILIFRP